MKKMILTAALFTGLSFVTYAQNNNSSKQGHQREQMTPDQRASKDAERAQQQLGLSADQTTKWQAAALERAQANEPLKEKSMNATPEEKTQLHSQMKTNNDKFDAAVSTFLTPEQKAKYEQNKNEKHEMHRGGGGMK